MKKIIVLRSAFTRALGLMFRRELGERVFVFPYPRKARRLYQTFFCPPMRMLALARSGEKSAAVVMDRLVRDWRFVSLPPTDLVVEMAMESSLDERLITDILAATEGASSPELGGIAANSGIQNLIFALFAAAVADIRRVRAVCGISGFGQVDPAIIQRRFSPWERGKILASAGFILDYRIPARISVPEGAVYLSEQVLHLERAYQDELLAAAIAGMPWIKDFSPACLRCGKPSTWRFILPSGDLPPELAWRLARPENAVPLCRDCVRKLHFAKDEALRQRLVWGLWGPRFEALQRWLWAVQGVGAYRLPRRWDREAYPLWPREFGGESWATGSGALRHCEPQEPQRVRRTRAQRKALSALLGRRGEEK